MIHSLEDGEENWPDQEGENEELETGCEKDGRDGEQREDANETVESCSSPRLAGRFLAILEAMPASQMLHEWFLYLDQQSKQKLVEDIITFMPHQVAM